MGNFFLTINTFGQLQVDESKTNTFCAVWPTPDAVVTEVPHLPDAVTQPGFLVAVVGERHRSFRKTGHGMAQTDPEKAVPLRRHQPPAAIDVLSVEETGLLTFHIGKAAVGVEFSGLCRNADETAQQPGKDCCGDK